MTRTDSRDCEVLLSLQGALLWEVGPHLRAITVRYIEHGIDFEAYFDREIGDAKREAMALATQSLTG